MNITLGEKGARLVAASVCYHILGFLVELEGLSCCMRESKARKKERNQASSQDIRLFP